MDPINQELTRSFAEFLHILNQSEAASGKRFLDEHAVPPMVKDGFLKFADPISVNTIRKDCHDPAVSFQFYLSVKLLQEFVGSFRKYSLSNTSVYAFLDKFGICWGARIGQFKKMVNDPQHLISSCSSFNGKSTLVALLKQIIKETPLVAVVSCDPDDVDGIGRHVARQLAGLGIHVLLTSGSLVRDDLVARSPAFLAGKYHLLPSGVDLTAHVRSRFGRIDFVIDRLGSVTGAQVGGLLPLLSESPFGRVYSTLAGVPDIAGDHFQAIHVQDARVEVMAEDLVRGVFSPWSI